MFIRWFCHSERSEESSGLLAFGDWIPRKARKDKARKDRARMTKRMTKGYTVVHANNGEKGYNHFLSDDFNLAIIDVMLPQMDGFTLAKQIRKINKLIPILFLTAKTATTDVIAVGV